MRGLIDTRVRVRRLVRNCTDRHDRRVGRGRALVVGHRQRHRERARRRVGVRRRHAATGRAVTEVPAYELIVPSGSDEPLNR